MSLKFSIITPSFNQGQFIEETIKSVQNQTYKNFEHIVIDGGSTDNTLKILKKYTGKIKWISEKDKGQPDAVNKGIRLSKGDYILILNSDDILLKDSLFNVNRIITSGINRNEKPLLIIGDYRLINEKSKKIISFIPYFKKIFWYLPPSLAVKITNFIAQPSVFISKYLIKKFGYFKTNLKYSFEYEYWLRLLINGTRPYYLNKVISLFRINPNSLGGSNYEKLLEYTYDKIVAKCVKEKFFLLLNKTLTKLIIFIYKFSKRKI